MVMRMLVIIAMPMVHEQMHQRASEQQQEWQHTEQVGAVFREQEEPGNREKTIKHPAGSGKMLCFVWIGYGSLLFQGLFL